MNKEYEDQLRLDPDQEDENFPDEYGLDSYNASDDLPSAEQCGQILRSLLSGANQQLVMDLEKEKPKVELSQRKLSQYREVSSQDVLSRLEKLRLADVARKKKEEHQKILKQKEDVIKEGTKVTKRAYDSLPHFYKFPMWKAKPYRTKIRNKENQLVFEPFTKQIKFEGIQATALFSGGELGYQDRLVYIAVYNQAIRHESFLKRHGKLYLSLNQIADEAGLSKTSNHKTKIKESLERLQRTELYFTKGFGSFLTARFSMFSYAGAKKVKEVQAELKNAQEYQMLFCLNEKKTNREITQIEFSSEIVKVICESNQKTTVDMWALQQLDGVEQTLFLYLYDFVQVNQTEQHTMSLVNLFELAGVELKTCKNKKGKTFVDWKTSQNYLKKKIAKVLSVAKFFSQYAAFGEKEQIQILFSFDLQARQIPKKQEN